jgi:acetyl-CoA carboxylase biotin carboxyl carrier protein
VELRQIKELMTAMGRSGIKKLSLKREGIELTLEREEHSHSQREDLALDFPEEPLYRRENEKRKSAALARGQELSANLAATAATDLPASDTTSLYVTSPMVGTFYASPSPEDPPFVKVGDKIDKNTLMCIVEAMKVMNEVKAGISGVVAEVLIEAGHPVEFGTKQFRIT